MESPFQQIHDILWDDDKEETRRQLVAEILESKRLRDIPDAVDEFVNLIKDVISEPQNDPLFDQIIREILEVRNHQADNLAQWQNTSDAIIKLLHYKLNYRSEVADQKLIYELYRSIAETYPPNYDDFGWARFFTGHADTCFKYAKSIRNIELIHESITLYKQALDFLENGSFPDYWAVHNAMCNEQICMANAIYDAYEISPDSFKEEFQKTPSLIEQATENYLNEINNKVYSSGYSLRVEGIDRAQKRYEKLKG